MSAYPNCTHKLQAQGVAYPRTCAECGLGPCKAESTAATAKHNEFTIVLTALRHYEEYVTDGELQARVGQIADRIEEQGHL